MKTTRRVWLAVLVGFAALVLPAGLTPLAAAQVGSDTASPEGQIDEILFKDGRTVQGRIVEETPTTVSMIVIVGSIKAVTPTVYEKSGILKLTRGVGTEEEVGEEPERAVAEKPRPRDRAGAKRVYVLELEGVFGEDISQTPIRKAIDDARKDQADCIVVVMNNDWSVSGALQREDRPDEEAQFDELFRVKDMDEIFTKEIGEEWDYQPEIVFWIKQAMGGAAFLPLISPNIYFHSDARLGGIGNLATMMQGVGDVEVQEKQRSLRLTTAQGMALVGGYDPRIIEAMARHDYQLWVRYDGDTPIFIDDPDDVNPATDILLTDDGQGENADTMEQQVRGEGNDTLTLRADIAEKLKFSKGTADTIEDLMYSMGIERTYQIIDGQSERILESWRDGLARAKRQLVELWSDFQGIQVTGDWNERKRARGRQLRTLENMQRLLKIYEFEKAINPYALGVPPFHQIETMKVQIRLEQMADKRD